jgi:hypothetical protein
MSQLATRQFANSIEGLAMTTDTFKKRGTALEDEFFHRVDEKLVKRLREQWQHDRDVESLKRETRITDESVIEALLDAGILPGMIQVMMLVPAIHVAWANGFVEKPERDAVLRAANSIGIDDSSTTGHLLLLWLEREPKPELFQAWWDYIVALTGVLDIAAYRHLHDTAVGTAKDIAEATGGFLGIHSISAEEQTAIDQIDDAFQNR